MKVGFIFPGQGSQSLQMLSALSAQYPIVLETFQAASDVLGYDAWELAQAGPQEQLNQTEYTQPLLLAADVAVWRCFQVAACNIEPVAMAGHSLGEYAALVCAKVLPFEAAVQLVANRGRYMQDAVALGEGAMAAIIGLEDDVVQQVCDEAAQGQVVSPANFNAIGQVVIAGHLPAVERAVALAKSKGAKLAKMLPVSVPSHCALMRPAAERLAEDLSALTLAPPQLSVIHNVDVAAHREPADICAVLAEQLYRPVRWVETIQYMASQGVEHLIECGPGKVLSGLVKRISPNVRVYACEQPKQFNVALSTIRGDEVCH